MTLRVSRLTASTGRGVAWSPLGLTVAAVLLLSAFGASVGIGFAGGTRDAFSWGLFAQVATAFCTALLAAYTAWLASTTRREVAVSVEQQLARDRPIVIVVAEAVHTTALEPIWGERVEVLSVRVLNVGLGPALDLCLRATYLDTPGDTEEVISVLPVGTEMIRLIALERLSSPDGGFLVEKFQVSGSFLDRTRTDRHDILVLADAGLRDLQRDAERIAAVRANPYFSPGASPSTDGQSVEYQGQFGNTARGTAESVRIVLRDDERAEWGEVTASTVRPNFAEAVVVRLPANHPVLFGTIYWHDGTGEHSRDLGTLYQPPPK